MRLKNITPGIGLLLALGTCSTATLLTEKAMAPTAQAATSTVCGPGAITAVRNGDSTLQRWTDSKPLSPGGFSASAQTGSGWGDARLTAADTTDGLMFAVFNDGTMRSYHFDAASGVYTGGSTIGHGWGGMTSILAQGDGVLYAVNTAGDMLMYQYDAERNDWSVDGIEIGHGWNKFSLLASGGHGIVYGIDKSTGELSWYKRATFDNPNADDWSAPKVVGHGWGGFTSLIGAGDGILYGVQSDGTLQWYNHLGAQTGNAAWKGPVTIGDGWNGFHALTTSPVTCTEPDSITPPSGSEPASTLANANVGKTAGTCAVNPTHNSLGGSAFEGSCVGYAGVPEYWCADFVKWSWEHSGYNVARLDASAESFASYGTDHATRHTKASVGDALVFSNGHHVGIVLAVNADGSLKVANGDWGGSGGSGEVHFATTSSVKITTIPAAQASLPSVTSHGAPIANMGGYYISAITSPAK